MQKPLMLFSVVFSIDEQIHNEATNEELLAIKENIKMILQGVCIQIQTTAPCGGIEQKSNVQY